MSSCGCGCSGEKCGCCAGTQKLTPVSTENRPGLDAIRYRVGTHGAFLETMKARLGEMSVDAPGADGQTIERWRPLAGLTTRDPSDPAIALLDGWATVGDVLTFYQERIANEGFLRTATERRSVLELARLVGYAPRPGVAATAYLAYTVDEHQSEAVQIPIGTRSQTVPGPDELPQAFETSDVLEARSAWNNLQVRLTRPTNITLADALSREFLYAAGTATGLKKGDPLLLSFGSDGYPAVMRTVRSIEPQFEIGRTRVELQGVPLQVQKAVDLLRQFIAAATVIAEGASAADRTAIAQFIAGVSAVRDELYLGFIPDFRDLAKNRTLWRGVPDELASALKQLLEGLAELGDIPEPAPPGGVPVTDPSHFETALLRPPKAQARNALALARSLQTAFSAHSDALPQLAIHLAPKLHDQFYAAWRNAAVSDAVASLDGVYALRVQATRFGANAARQPTYFQSEGPDHRKGELEPAADWAEWALDGESDTTLFLDQAYQEILPDSLIVVQRGARVTSHEVRQVLQASTVQRNAYGLSGKSTKLTLNESRRSSGDSMAQLRSTLVYAQSEKLPLADEPVTPDVVSGSEIALDQLYGELKPGRWVIVSGERADIDEVSGVRASELLMISNVRQDYDPLLPGDRTRTTLILATPTAYSYWRSTVTIYGNVVRATNGETRHEPLGGGDGSQSLQTFALKQTPLTFVSAPNARGVKSTLAVYVNDVEWHEADSLAELGPKDRRFITRTDDAGVTTVVFGTGAHGARLPTGLQNVQAVYRNGIGAGGNARAEQISLMQTRPLGVRGVINPLRASGGADRESRDQARINAPLAVMALDRLVSVADYADFTRTFAGIGKALAKKLPDGREQLVHVTIAGVDDIPIDLESDLYRNLVTALEDLGDPDLPLQVAERELKTLVLSANIELAPDYQWDPVVTAVRAALLDTFGFQRAQLGWPVLLSQVISRMQAVPGVAYVDVDAFGGVDERVADPITGERELISLEEMSAAIAAIAAQTTPARRVDVNVADVERGRIRPAQLAIFAPAVPDTLILNQIP